MVLGQGVNINGSPLTPSQIAWPNFSPGFYPISGVIPDAGPQFYDPNAGRPARQYQWSFSVQREVARDLVFQASYIGNRGIWWPTYVGQPLVNYNYLSNAILAQNGLSLNNPRGRCYLASTDRFPRCRPLPESASVPRLPSTLTVAQSLRPFPQFIPPAPVC